MSRGGLFTSEEECLSHLGSKAYAPLNATVPYCNGTYDSLLCWPAAPASSEVKQRCPELRGLDPNKFGSRICLDDGHWASGPNLQPNGWTNYTGCYTKEGNELYNKYSDRLQLIKNIAYGARVLEISGLCVSFIALLAAVFIICIFRNLRCDRTRIHRNLFIAILIHVAILLVKYTDSFVAWHQGSALVGSFIGPKGTIYETAALCETLEVLVQYTKTVMFMWMFLEGLYLHNMLVISVFSSKPNYAVYYILGWGSPVLPTSAWALTTGLLHKAKCWHDYIFLKYYWILEGPRAAIIAINLIFLLNIIRVLVTKLQQTNSNETLQVKKAVKAAIVLLPLLGLNNFLAMVDAPAEIALFAIWSITSTFLASFQGFFIALLYCFLNGEVRHTVHTWWERRRQRTGGYSAGQRRFSRTMSVFTSVSEVPLHQIQPTTMSDVNGNANRMVSYSVKDTAL